MAPTLVVEPHPLLEAVAFTTRFSSALGQLSPAAEALALLQPGASGLMTSNDEIRGQVRELLRHGGYKPTGRGKPASEYLLRAVAEGALGSINPAVDVCNAVSFHSGLPISVVDLAKAEGPLRIRLARPGESYVFNAGGQVIDVSGLLCLFDAQGPCANAVKDAQRTKTSPQTVETLSVVWGTTALPGRAAQAATWYRRLLESLGASTEQVAFSTTER